MKEKIQRVGGAMFTPVLFFVFSGIVIAFTSVLNNPLIVGDIAQKGTLWNTFWSIIESGGWTVFNNMELLFIIGIPVGLAKMAKGRAGLESFVIYMTFNTFIAAILEHMGSTFGIDYSQEPGTGLKMIGGVKTLDTGVLGAIVIALIVVYLHNKYFEKKLPEWLGVFQGSALVTIIGFFVMLLLAFIFSAVWPTVQNVIESLQSIMANSGNIGVFIYILLEKALLPTGLHHFIYAPFQFGPAVVEGGTTLYWMEHMKEFAASTQSLKELFPEGGFALQGLSNLFGIPGIALAFYATAKKENRKKLLAMIVPGVITAVLAGVTEPFDYTFLFIAPQLFLVHAVLAAILATTQYIFGVVGVMGGGLIEIIFQNWVPMWYNHWSVYIIQIIIGLIFICIYFFVFKYLILRFDLPTPGRGESTVLYSKADYRQKGKPESAEDGMLTEYEIQAKAFLDALGGSENIDSVTNCATRLRVTVIDTGKVHDDHEFKQSGAHGVVRSGKGIQVIVGMSVQQVKEAFDVILDKERANH